VEEILDWQSKDKNILAKKTLTLTDPENNLYAYFNELYIYNKINTKYSELKEIALLMVKNNDYDQTIYFTLGKCSLTEYAEKLCSLNEVLSV
jgi:hypothetical protein